MIIFVSVTLKGINKKRKNIHGIALANVPILGHAGYGVMVMFLHILTVILGGSGLKDKYGVEDLKRFLSDLRSIIMLLCYNCSLVTD